MSKNIKLVKNPNENEIDKLIGIEKQNNKYYFINKKEWKNCIYCQKFHHNDYYISNMEYCIHCWGWLNCDEYNLETGIYNGDSSLEDINKMIKKVYPIHCDSKCENNECIFNKMQKHFENKTMHDGILELLELNKKPQQVAICFNYKNKNLNVNFDESYIVI